VATVTERQPVADKASPWISLAALSGLLSVVAGAIATHAISDPGARELLRTGANYEAIHALAALAAVALTRNAERPAWIAPALFLGGTVLFSGSLYALALGAPRWTGAITPFGGLSFMAGWAVLVIQGARGRI
jgi:uncharacterized membrane protein YgdD (TMEM256/DUF423 family)